jgi:hypothetical protein
LQQLLLLSLIYSYFIYLHYQIPLKTRLLLLVGFDTLIYRKYYDTPPLYLWIIKRLLAASSIAFSLTFANAKLCLFPTLAPAGGLAHRLSLTSANTKLYLFPTSATPRPPLLQPIIGVSILRHRDQPRNWRFYPFNSYTVPPRGFAVDLAQGG